MNRYLRGVNDFWWAAKLIATNPRLWKWLVAPAIIAGITIVALIGAVWTFSGQWSQTLVELLPGWLAFLVPIIRGTIVLLGLVLAYVAFFVVASIVTGPFSEFLAEDVETIQTGQSPPAFAFSTFARDLVLGISHAARRLVIYLATMLLLFVVGALLPVVGPLISLVGGIWVTIRAAAFDTVDCTLARKGMTYAAKKSFLRTWQARANGIGAVVALLMMIPVVNLIVLPIGAAAASRLYVQSLGQAPVR